MLTKSQNKDKKDDWPEYVKVITAQKKVTPHKKDKNGTTLTDILKIQNAHDCFITMYSMACSEILK